MTTTLLTIYEQMASALKKRVKGLTRAERNQAVVNEVIRSGNEGEIWPADSPQLEER